MQTQIKCDDEGEETTKTEIIRSTITFKCSSVSSFFSSFFFNLHTSMGATYAVPTNLPTYHSNSVCTPRKKKLFNEFAFRTSALALCDICSHSTLTYVLSVLSFLSLYLFHFHIPMQTIRV
jgi:hypothetical protein